MTNLLVPGRGHDVTEDGSLRLSTGSIERVETAADYYFKHSEAFEQSLEAQTGGIIVMSGGFGTLSTGVKREVPLQERESSLMCGLAMSWGLPARYLASSPMAPSTLENILLAKEEGFFGKVGPDNPLGIVTHSAQWERLSWFANRTFKLPSGSINLIPVPTDEPNAVINDERKLMIITKLLYGPARTPEGLRRAEKIASVAAALATRLGLQTRPAENYVNQRSN